MSGPRSDPYHGKSFLNYFFQERPTAMVTRVITELEKPTDRQRYIV